jgi:hypothetical protein
MAFIGFEVFSSYYRQENGEILELFPRESHTCDLS